MKRDHRYLLLAVALMLLPLVGITAAQIFPIFDPPLFPFGQPQRQCVPTRQYVQPQVCVPTQDRSCAVPQRRPMVPAQPYVVVEPLPRLPGDDQPGDLVDRLASTPYTPSAEDLAATYTPTVSVAVGEVLTVGPDEPASVSIHETDPGRYLLTFWIPRGRDGRDGERGEQGLVGVTGLTGDPGDKGHTPTINVKAIAREVAKELPPIIVRTIDDSGNQVDREEINLGEVLNLHHRIALPNREGS